MHLGAIHRYTRCPLYRLALCEINESRGTSNKFCISTATAIHEISANHREHGKLEGGTNAVKVVRRVKAIVNSCVCVISTLKVMFCPKRKHKWGFALDGILRLKTQH